MNCKLVTISLFSFFGFVLHLSGLAQTDIDDKANELIQAGKYEDARALIDSKLNDSKYNTDGQYWYLRGFTYKSIYTSKEKSNKESPARITALESFKKSLKLNPSAENVVENKKNIKFLATTLYNDVTKGLDTANYNIALRNFDLFKKYYYLSDASATDLLNNDISFKLALASIYEKLFKKSPSHGEKVKYFNMANQLYDEVLAVSKDPKAKLDKATLMADAAVYQIDANAKEFKQEIDLKSTTISKLDKDNQLKQNAISLLEKDKQLKDAELATKELEIQKKELENTAKNNELRQQSIIRNTFIVGFAIMLLFSLVIFRQRNNIAKEKKRSDELLLNILPEEVAEELKKTGSAKAKYYNHVSVLFTDFVGFTIISEKLSPSELVEEIHSCFTAFDAIIERNGLEKIKTIGDAYLAVCGMPNEDENHAQRTVQAGIEIMEFINKRIVEGGKFKIRIGINSGPVIAGIVGVKKFAYDIWGDAVNTAARMEQTSVHGKINISGATYELVKNDFECTYRGKIDAKNKGEIDMYFVESRKK